MLLAVDVGNTNVTLGLFRDRILADSWRLQTQAARTRDEYSLLVRRLLIDAGHDLSDVSDIIMASVVPAVGATLCTMFERLFGLAPHQVGPGSKTGVPIDYRPPTDVGADRIVNAVAAIARVGPPCIVVDFGTATTFDCVNAKGAYVGGVIAPGVDLAVSALVRGTAKLPRVDVRKPSNVVGKSTTESIQSGAFFGYVALVDGLVERIRQELGASATVLATGGLAGPITAESTTIHEAVEDLTLEGLELIHRRNAARASRTP